MQEYEEDFYETGEGCCLICPESYEGCLCKECNCKICYWYTSPEDWNGENGHCDKTDDLKEEGRKKAKKNYIKQSYIELKKTEKLKEENKKIEKPINNNWYSCQRCQRDFISKEDKIINLNKNPICSVCEGKIILTKEELEEIEIKVKKETEKEEENDRRTN